MSAHRPGTKDAFHRGAFWLVQPAGGHRAGMDAMMLAAAVPTDFAGRLADLGAGAGAAGLAVAARCRKASVVLVERSPQMVGFAEQTLALPENRFLRDRVSLLCADVTVAGERRRAAGLTDRSFDYAIMNPPFNPPADRATPDILKRQAHVMEDGHLERWIRTASAIVKPRGGLALIARPSLIGAIVAALDGRFGAVRVKPIHPHPQARAIRIVMRAIRGSRGALTLEPPLALHAGPGADRDKTAVAISNGLAGLFVD